MTELNFNFKLDEVLSELDITRNNLAVEAKIRPATVQDLYNGKTKRLELATIEALLKVINDVAIKKGINKTYKIDDIIEFIYEKEGDQ
ncbi:helix-turn-helix domain-containing protein [Bacillus sp. JJ722]|uniref:helix-turn-helix domain-containing protein n=1 Tax=Bacillus sp. JJ722 TaxID=3122973 RepID=UPI002FFED28B